MSRDPVDRVLAHTMNLPPPYDPILNPSPFLTPKASVILPYNPHELDDDFKPATGDGK